MTLKFVSDIQKFKILRFKILSVYLLNWVFTECLLVELSVYWVFTEWLLVELSVYWVFTECLFVELSVYWVFIGWNKCVIIREQKNYLEIELIFGKNLHLWYTPPCMNELRKSLTTTMFPSILILFPQKLNY